MKWSKELTTVTRFSKFFALFLFVLLPIIAFVLGMNIGRKPMSYPVVKNQNNSHRPIASLTPVNTSPNHIQLPIVYSSDADFVIRPEIIPQADGSYEMVFTIGHRSESSELVMRDATQGDPQNRVIWKEKIDAIYKSRLDRFVKEYGPSVDDSGNPTLVTWSPDDSKIALYLLDNIVIFDLTINTINKESQGATYNNHVITVNKQNSVQIPISESQIYDPELFFSGDGSELYYKSIPDAVKFEKILLTTLEISRVDAPFPYPIPNSKGVVYWEESDTFEEHPMVVYTGDTKKRYLITQAFDYGGKIVLSPQRDKVCFENGSSGYYGYSLYDLTEDRMIEGGIQYSHCVKWLDNNTILVKETPFYYPEYFQYFIINTQTKQKTLLSQESSRY